MRNSKPTPTAWRTFSSQLGVEPGDRVMWCGRNSHWPVACGHAARKVGAVSVPLNYRLTPEEAAYVVHNSDAKVALVDAEFAKLFAEIRPETPNVERVLVYDGAPAPGQTEASTLIEAADAGPLTVDADPAASGTMIYTSGTTGKPKGAVRGGGPGDPSAFAAMMEMFRWRPDDVYLTTGPLYHSGPSGFLALGQLLGNTAVLQRSFDAEDWLRLLDTYGVTCHVFGADTDPAHLPASRRSLRNAIPSRPVADPDRQRGALVLCA